MFFAQEQEKMKKAYPETPHYHSSFVAGEVPHIVQRGPTCVAASLWSVLSYYKLDVPSHTTIYRDIQEQNSFYDGGLYLTWIPRYVKDKFALNAFTASLMQNGLRSRSDAELVQALKNFSRADIPIIISMDTPSGVGHVVVVTDVTDRHIYLNDTSKYFGKGDRYDIEDFLSVWKPNENAEICVIAPPGKRFTKKIMDEYYKPQNNIFGGGGNISIINI